MIIFSNFLKGNEDKTLRINSIDAEVIESLDQEILSLSGNVVIKTELDKKGKFGRILGVIWDKAKKKNFNNMLVSEGHAVEYKGGKR